MAYYYSEIGFFDKAKHYYNEAFILIGDSAGYLSNLGFIEWSQGNFVGSLELTKRAYRIDSTKPIEDLIYYFLPSRYDEEAYQNAEQWVKYYKKALILPPGLSCRIGYAFLKAGKKAEAQYYLDQEVRFNEDIIKLGRAELNWGAAYYHLAISFAILGDKEKTYKYLDEWNKKKVFPVWWVMMLKHEPFFDKYRNEERFQKIVKDVESKYNAEHERVRKWLEENNML